MGPGDNEIPSSSPCFSSPSHVFSLTMVSKVMSGYRLKPQAKSSLFSYKLLSGCFVIAIERGPNAMANQGANPSLSHSKATALCLALFCRTDSQIPQDPPQPLCVPWRWA